MIYWLCLFCCVQSSFYAHPVVRRKHNMNTFLKIPDARSELRRSDSEYPEFNVKSLPYWKNVPHQELNILNRNSPLGKKTQCILPQQRERNKEKDHVNHNSHTDHWWSYIKNGNNAAKNKYNSFNYFQPPINHKHVGHSSKSGQSNHVLSENDELEDGTSNSESYPKVNETGTLTYDDDLEVNRISSLIVTVEQENDMNNMNAQTPQYKNVAAPNIEICNRNENNTRLNKTLRNVFARAPDSYFFPSENRQFTNVFKRYKHKYPNKRQYSNSNLNLDANQFGKNDFSEIPNTEVNKEPLKFKSKPNLNIVQNPYLDSIGDSNLASLEISKNRLPNEIQDSIDQSGQLDAMNNFINKPFGVKSKSKPSIVQNPFLDSVGSNSTVGAESRNNKIPNKIHETVGRPSELHAINNDLKEDGEIDLDNSYFVTPIDINEIKQPDHYKEEFRNTKENVQKKQGFYDEAEEDKSGSQISDYNALPIESGKAYVPLQKPLIPLKFGPSNHYKQFDDFRSIPLFEETNPPRNMMKIANEKDFEDTGSEENSAFQSSGGTSNFEPLRNSIPIEDMQPEQMDKGIELNTITKPPPIHTAPIENSGYKNGVHNKKIPDSVDPLKSAHHYLEGGKNLIDVPQSNPYTYPDSSDFGSNIVKDNLDIPLSEERFEPDLKSASDLYKNPFFETNRYALGYNPEMVKAFGSKIKKDDTDPVLDNKDYNQSLMGYVNDSAITTDMIPDKNSSSYENASVAKDNSTGLESFYNTVSGKIQDIINRTKEMFNFQTTENEHTDCGSENSTHCNATSKDSPLSEKNEKNIRKKNVLNERRDQPPVIGDSDEITTILNSDFYKTFNDDTIAEAYFESTWDPDLKEKQGRIISELTNDHLIRGSDLRHLYPRGGKKTMNVRFSNPASDTEEGEGISIDNFSSASKAQTFGHKFKPKYKTYKTPIREDQKYSNVESLEGNMDELNHFYGGEHHPVIKKHFENDESDDSPKNMLREDGYAPDLNLSDNFGLKFKPKYTTYETPITNYQRYSNERLLGNNLDELNHFSGEHQPIVKNHLEKDESEDSSKNELLEKDYVPGDLTVGDNSGLKLKHKTYETPITDDRKYSNEVKQHPENDESGDSPENMLRENGYTRDLNLDDKYGIKSKTKYKTNETPIKHDEEYSNEELLRNNMDELNHFSEHHPIIKKHLKSYEHDDSPENELRENGFTPRELNSEECGKKFLDANRNCADENSALEQKLSRKLEDVRTKQTVLRDGNTKKETNIIEKENKRVLDSIKFIGNSRTNSNKGEYGNRLGVPNRNQEPLDNIKKGKTLQESFDPKISGVSNYGINSNAFSSSTLLKDSYPPEYESDDDDDIENSPTFTSKPRPIIPLSEKSAIDKNKENHNVKKENYELHPTISEPDMSSRSFEQNYIYITPPVSKIEDLNIKINPQNSDGGEKYSKDNQLETNNENELGTDSSMLFPTLKEDLEDYFDAEKSIKDDVPYALNFNGKLSDFYKSNKSPKSGTYKEIPKNINENINNPVKYNSENDDAQNKYKPLSKELAENVIDLIRNRNPTSLHSVENHPITFNSENNDAEVLLKSSEEHKSNPVSDYKDITFSPANSGTEQGSQSENAEHNELSNEYDSISQNMDDIENNYDELPTGTLISNGDKELKRIEKVEKQSNIIIKNKGSMTNQTSRLVSERKTDIKNNKKIYHEAYVQEKVERNYPKTYEGESNGKRNLKDPSTHAKSIDTTMENTTDDESDTESPVTLESTVAENLSEIKPLPELTNEPNNRSDYVPPRPKSVLNPIESIKRSSIQEGYASNDRTEQKHSDEYSDSTTEEESDYVTEESDNATEDDYYDDTPEESEDERLNEAQESNDQVREKINLGLNGNSKTTNSDDISRRPSKEPVINLSKSKILSIKTKPSVETGIEQVEDKKYQEEINKIRAKIKSQLSNSKEGNEEDSRMMPYNQPSNLKYSSIKTKPSVETGIEKLEDMKNLEEIDKIRAKIKFGITDSKTNDEEDSSMMPEKESSYLKYSFGKKPSVETGIERLEDKKKPEIDRNQAKIESGLTDSEESNEEDSSMIPYNESSNLKYSSIKTKPLIETAIEQLEDQIQQDKIGQVRSETKSGLVDSNTSNAKDSRKRPYNGLSNLKYSSIKTKPSVGTGIEQLEGQKNQEEKNKITAKIKSGITDSKKFNEENSRMIPYNQAPNLKYSSNKINPSVETTGSDPLEDQTNQEEIDKTRTKIKSGLTDSKATDEENSRMIPYNEAQQRESNLKYYSIKIKPSVETTGSDQLEDLKNQDEIGKIRAKIKSGVTDSNASDGEDSRMMPYNGPYNFKNAFIKTKPSVETGIEQLVDQKNQEGIHKIRAKIESELRGNSKPREEEDSRMSPYRGQIINLLNQIGSSSKTRPSVERGMLGNSRSKTSDNKPLDAELFEQSKFSETKYNDPRSGLDFETDQPLTGKIKDFEESYRAQQENRRRSEKSINFALPSEETQDKVLKFRSTESKVTESAESIPVEKSNETTKSFLDNQSGNMIYITMKTTTDKQKMLSDFVDIQKVRRYSREFHS